MRVAIRLVVKFMLWYAAALFGIGTVLLAREYGLGVAIDSTTPLLHAAVRSVAYASLPAVVFASCVSLFALVRSASAPAASLVALGLCWTLMIVVSGLLVSLPSAAMEPPRATLPVDRVVRAGSAAVYIVGGDAGTPQAVVVREVAQGFTVFAADPSYQAASGRSAEVLAEAAAGLGPIRTLPRSLARTVDDVTTVYRAFRLDAVSISALLQIGALSIFMLGCWTLVRLTRWPLFNALLVVASLRAAIWFVAAANEGPIRDLVVLGFSSRAVPYVGSAVLAFSGLALLSIAVFLPKLDTWKRELVDG